MPEAPERIWAWTKNQATGLKSGGWRNWNAVLVEDTAEYVRADLLTAAQERIEALEGENARLRAELSQAKREERLNLQTVTAYASGFEAGQEAIRERAAVLCDEAVASWTFSQIEEGADASGALARSIRALPVEEG